MLSVTIENAKQRVKYQHTSGDLLLGRSPCDGPHVVIDDDYVSRRHLLLRPQGNRSIHLENLGRNEVELEDGRKLLQGQASEIPLPAVFRVGRTAVRVEFVDKSRDSSALAVSDESGALEYKTVAAPVRSPLTTTISLSTLGQTPTPEKLAEWFERLVSVQRSAVGSTEFYDETARAVVDLVGLDRALVLLRDGDVWATAAGYAKDDRVGLRYSQSVLQRVLRQRRTFYGNPRELAAQNSLVGIQAVVASPIFDGRDAIVGVVYGSRDFSMANLNVEIQPLEAQVVQLLAGAVTAGLVRLEMEQRLKQAEQLAAVGQALGYIIHDLRGPLGNAQQLTEMLREGDTSVMSRAEQMAFIDESIDISLSLLNDSLEFCRGNVRVQPVAGNCRELLDRHLRLLAIDLNARHVQLEIDIPDQLKVCLDADRMARVLRNLAKNAAEALDGTTAPQVTIGARAVDRSGSPAAEAGSVELWVADNGPGLPAAVLDNLFQPFGTHGKRGGTGFGLAIAKQLVEAHGGEITVTTGVDGTCFVVQLSPLREDATTDTKQVGPVSKSAYETLPDEPAEGGLVEHEPVEHELVASEPVATGERASSPARRVLVVDDSLVNQRLLQGLLEDCGCQAQIATNGQEAVDAFRGEAFDLVLMDIEMPIMDGLEATAAIRACESERGYHIPILAMTAHEDPEILASAERAGMDGHLTKPVMPAQLTAALEGHQAFGSS